MGGGKNACLHLLDLKYLLNQPNDMLSRFCKFKFAKNVQQNLIFKFNIKNFKLIIDQQI